MTYWQCYFKLIIIDTINPKVMKKIDKDMKVIR